MGFDAAHPASKLDWKGWTNTSKPVDRDRPFHRINSPTFLEEELLREGESEDERQNRVARLRKDGRGFNRGCKIPDDIPMNNAFQLLVKAFTPIFGKPRDVREAIRCVPSWVPVDDEQMREIEGVTLRSYQTWTDAPLFQWHHWYDWNLF